MVTLTMWEATHLAAERLGANGLNPGVRPRTDGLPGIGQIRQIVGSLLVVGLIACAAGIAISAIVMAIGSFSERSGMKSAGKIGIIVAALAAVVIGGANAIVFFFAKIGGQI